MRGDILLFKTDGSLSAWFISKFTHGPFVHVAIDLGDNTEIAAHPRGVSRQDIYLNKGEMVRVPLGERANSFFLERAVGWLESQVGEPYGWVDIIDSALGILGLPIFFFERNHHDCSTLASLFINRLGLDDLYIDTPDLVSPNDLARILHIL